MPYRKTTAERHADVALAALRRIRRIASRRGDGDSVRACAVLIVGIFDIPLVKAGFDARVGAVISQLGAKLERNAPKRAYKPAIPSF